MDAVRRFLLLCLTGVSCGFLGKGNALKFLVGLFPIGAFLFFSRSIFGQRQGATVMVRF